ncbi:MAG: hypothetical protein ACPLXA_04215 [Moorellaceae bacterium]
MPPWRHQQKDENGKEHIFGVGKVAVYGKTGGTGEVYPGFSVFKGYAGERRGALGEDFAPNQGTKSWKTGEFLEYNTP